MDNPEEHSLQSRIAKLERDMAAIKETLETIAPPRVASVAPAAKTAPDPVESIPPEAPVAEEPETVMPPQTPDESAPPVPPPPPPPGRPTPAPAEPRTIPDQVARPPAAKGFEIPAYMKTGEFWLNKVGIGLLLFGVAFVFKYSIEQGWITPPIRHLFGLLVGGVLLFLGFRLYGRRRHFARVLLGGSIGTFYITGFSAFQLFALVSHTVAFAFMIGVTGLAFFLALKQDDAIFSLIGTAGALGTPFLLYTESGNLPALIGYTCLVLAGTTAVYFFKGWRLLLWLSVIGGWVVLLVGLDAGDFYRRTSVAADQWAVQLGALFAWLNFWAAPTVRRVFRLKNPNRWPRPLLGIGDSSVSSEGAQVLERHLHLLAIGSPLLALMISNSVWPLVPDHIFGWAAMGAMVIYWLTAKYLQGFDDLKNLAYTHIAVGTLLFTIGLCLILDGHTLLFALASEALVLHVLARRLKDTRISFGGHVLGVVVGVWLFDRLMFEPGWEPAMFNVKALTDLWVVAALTAVAFLTGRPYGRRIYLIAGFLLLGLLFHRELPRDLLFFVLVVQTGAFYLVARKLGDEMIDTVSHAFYGAMGVWLVFRLFEFSAQGPALVNYQALVELALVASGFAVASYARDLPERRAYIMASFALLAGVFWRELDGNVLLLALTVEAAVVHVVAWKTTDQALTVFIHIGMAGLAAWMIERLTMARLADSAVINATALTDLLPIACALAAGGLLTAATDKLLYRLAAHLAILAWFARELSPLENGQGYVTAAWGIYAAILLIAGLRLNWTRLRQAALATLMLMVGKLFVVDLARLETIWRVLLFVGFGGVFLALSYYFPKLWKRDSPDSSPSDEPTGEQPPT